MWIWEVEEKAGKRGRRMSMYGESHYNEEKNYLYDDIKDFLERHPISELLQIVSDTIKYEKEEEEWVDILMQTYCLKN